MLYYWPADLWPTFKSSYVLLILVMGFALIAGLLIMSALLYRDIDLYLHGVIVEGTVKSVHVVEEQHGTGQKSFKTFFYRHTISYDGFEMHVEQRAKMKEDSKVAVYYSSQTPENAVLKTSAHPFKSMGDILETNNFKKFAVINIFLAFFCGLSVYGHRHAKPDPQL